MVAKTNKHWITVLNVNKIKPFWQKKVKIQKDLLAANSFEGLGIDIYGTSSFR